MVDPVLLQPVGQRLVAGQADEARGHGLASVGLCHRPREVVLGDLCENPRQVQAVAGDMRAVFNQVIEAQKRAAANVITRREETAARRPPRPALWCSTTTLFMMQDALRSGDQVRHLLLRGCGTLRTLDPIQHLRNLRSVTLRKSNIRCAATIVQHETLQRADLRESLLPEPLRNNCDGPQQIDILRELLRALKRRG